MNSVIVNENRETFVSGKYDVIVAGGSLGGVRAAISAAAEGKTVLLVEETDWIGGQLTSQAVPPDEHRWIESQGATASYLEYRRKVRDYYRNKENFSDETKKKECFCPGDSWVSRIAHEPVVAHELLSEEVGLYVRKGLITLKLSSKVCGAETAGDFVKNVSVINLADKTVKKYAAKFFLDATDCGELLPLTGTEYREGAESREETGEPHAAAVPCKEDVQPVTHVISLEMKEKLEPCDMIEKPDEYEYFLNKKCDGIPLFGWEYPDARTGKGVRCGMFDDEAAPGSLGFWSYRRVVGQRNYKSKVNEVSLVNWPQNDYADGGVYGGSDDLYHAYMAARQSMCLAYYLQNDADDGKGGKGYPVALCGESVGTKDGLAKAVYIRESRRIVGRATVREQDVSVEFNDKIKRYDHSVGVGHYAIDVHKTVVTHTSFYSPTYPFEIPMGALIPVRMKNLIPACKNISCTHLTNGCYRLHPVEWNVGEVAGLLAAFCIDKNCSPAEAEDEHYEEFEKLLVKKGVQLHWNEETMDLDKYISGVKG